MPTTEAHTSAITISEKYSGEPNLSATDASGGPTSAISRVPTQPAKNEPIAAIASAGPALPCWAIGWPSSSVTTEDPSPGRLTSIAVVEPP